MALEIIEQGWVFLLKYMGNFGVFVLAYTIMAVGYAVGGFIFYIIDKYRLLDKYKIQKGVC